MKFIKQLVILCGWVSLLLFFASCGMEEKERLKIQNDSLKLQLDENHQAVLAFKEISVLIDSADAARNILRLDMIEGIPYDNYVKRMERVLDYVKKSEGKIKEVQTRFKHFRDSTSGYVMMIEALTSELNITRGQIDDLQMQYDQTLKKNKELVNLVNVQKTQLTKNEVKIEESKKEISTYERRIAELMKESQFYQSELYFTRGEITYEEARRTKLAPRKKKDLLKESLELYQKASELGHKQASVKMEEVKKKI